METNNNSFIKTAYNNGFTDYELYICFFLKHFKFLNGMDYGGYYISQYSWFAQEHLIKFYSADKDITIVFFEEGQKMQIYFEIKKNFLIKKRIRLQQILKNKKIPNGANKKVNIENLEEIFYTYALLFKNELLGYLKGEKEFKI